MSITSVYPGQAKALLASADRVELANMLFARLFLVRAQAMATFSSVEQLGICRGAQR
jgi:hypothetical protein